MWRDTLRATAKAIQSGRTIIYYGCDIVRADGKLVAHATSTITALIGGVGHGPLKLAAPPGIAPARIGAP